MITSQKSNSLRYCLNSPPTPSSTSPPAASLPKAKTGQPQQSPSREQIWRETRLKALTEALCSLSRKSPDAQPASTWGEAVSTANPISPQKSLAGQFPLNPLSNPWARPKPKGRNSRRNTKSSTPSSGTEAPGSSCWQRTTPRRMTWALYRWRLRILSTSPRRQPKRYPPTGSSPFRTIG